MKRLPAMPGLAMRIIPTMPARTFLTAAMPAALLLALSGCVSFGAQKVPDTLLTLTPTASSPAGTVTTGTSEGAIVVLDPETDRRLSVQRVAVTVDAAQVAYLKQAMWVERPARLFRTLLAEAIRANGSRLVVEDSGAGAGGGTRLAGRLLDLGYDAQARAVVVRYDAIREGPGDLVATKRFEARVENVAPKAREVGPALNAAANDVARQVADWIG